VTESVKAAVRRLRAGVVPSSQLTRLSVGCDDIHALAEKALLALLDGERVFPTFVSGEWGSGKSHVLSYVRMLAAGTGIATAAIDLNARTAALNYPQRLLSIVARSLRVGDRTGLREILTGVLTDEGGRAQLATFIAGKTAGDLGPTLSSLLDATGRSASVDTLDHPAWKFLSGTDLSWSDHSTKREKALDRFEALAALFRALGLGGLVLILDEAETIDQLWNVRSRSAAYGTLGRLLRVPAIWCVLGTTDRFDRTIERDLATEMGGDAVRFLGVWRRRAEGLTTPPTIDDRRGRLLAERICALYEDAYGAVGDVPGLVDGCVTEWGRNPVRNPRRLLRSVVSALDRRRSLEPLIKSVDGAWKPSPKAMTS
jgi:hypothetical protein